MSVTITTSNVNGIRAAKRKGVDQWLATRLPDVWCLQEVRAPQSAIDPIFAEFQSLYAHQGRNLACSNDICRIAGRAGVALLTTLPVENVRIGLPQLNEIGDDVDTGRWLEADLRTPDGAEITVVSVYVHAGDADDDLKMSQKYRFLDAMNVRLRQMRDDAAAGSRDYVLCGDFNIAHTPLDIKNAKANETHSGFLPKERAYVDGWLEDADFVDVVRRSVGPIDGPYTWWSQRGRAFDNNVGWRLDYHFATPRLAKAATGFAIDKAPSYAERWSDHAALSVTYEL